ncbi:MAG: SAM-dependent methyltransferase [Jatrophihabitantaceae bacterium]
MQIPLMPNELHAGDRPSATAQWTTLARALELDRRPADRIVSDEYAPLFLTPAYRGVLESLRLGSPLVHLAERHELAGISTFVLLRHRYIDEQLGKALADGAEQVVVLGAGYDSRAYRFADELRGRPVHEVDLPPLSRLKAEIVAAHPDLFVGNSIRRVEIDFRTESLADRLLDSGFTVGVRTFVVWEGVSMYLSRLAVSATLGTLREICGSGSTLAMDFWHEPGGLHPFDQVRRAAAQAIRLIGEPVTFGLPPEHAVDFLDKHGFAVADLAESDELARRHATAGRRSEKSVYVVAAQLR